MLERSEIKGLVEPWIARSGLVRLALRRAGGRILVLAYHNVVPRGEAAPGDRSLHMSQDTFAQQLDSLLRSHEVISLATALADLDAGDPPPPGPPRAVITFDDAYRGSVTAGVEELARRGLPATVFVAPGLLGGSALWWDALAAERAGALPERIRREALGELEGRRSAVLARYGPGEGASLPPHMLPADEEELRRAVRGGGITLGSHSWSHPNLTRLGAGELDEELSRPLAWLRERFSDAAVPLLAYPYGLASPAVVKATREAGYAGALLVEGGWLPAHGADRFRLPRIHLSAGLSAAGFALRSSGVVQW